MSICNYYDDGIGDIEIKQVGYIKNIVVDCNRLYGIFSSIAFQNDEQQNNRHGNIRYYPADNTHTISDDYNNVGIMKDGFIFLC